MGRRPKNKTAKQNALEDKRERIASARMIPRLRGMRDILPEEYRYWELVLNKAESIVKYYGWLDTEIPVLENLALYERSTGKQTDIVSKEMYAFIDKDNDRVALRPEATPGLVRSYVEHGMFSFPVQPVKLYFIYNLLKELRLEAQVQINSIGCSLCRPEYVKKLVEYYKQRPVHHKLCPDCKKRLLKNPLRLLDCKEEACVNARAGAPQIVDHLCEECREHFVKVLEYLDELNVVYALNPHLVRGLDYYNRTVFEFCSEDSEQGRQNALGGGGRYDGLVEYLGGRPTPALGWALGVERIILKIKERNIPLVDTCQSNIFIAQLGEAAKRKAMIFFEELRKRGYKAAQNFVKDNLKAQLEYANKLGVKLTLILGQKELMDGTILIRDMESGMQEVFDFKKVYEELDKRLK